MRRLYNLTDEPRPGSAEAYPITLKKSGIVLEPGAHFDVSNKFTLGAISGWINTGLISVDSKPDWYIKAKKDALEKEADRRREKHKPEPELKQIEDEDEELEVELKGW